MARRTQTIRGALLVPDARTVDTTNLAVNDGGAANSSYTEAGPRPGSAVAADARSKLRPLITGGQSTGIDLRCTIGGHPGRRVLGGDTAGSGCEGIWKPDGGAATAWRGWVPHSVIMGWSSVVWTDAAVYDAFDVACIPSTQTAIAIYNDSLATQPQVKRWSYSSPGVWSGTTTPVWQGGLLTVGAVVTIVVIPGTERILAIAWDPVASATIGAAIDVSVSDDAGATWSAYSRFAWYTSPFGGSGAAAIQAERIRAVYHATTGGILLLCEGDTSGGGTGDIVQLASNDLGSAWYEPQAEAVNFGRHISAFAIPGTPSIGIVYREFATDLPYFVRIDSPFDGFSAKTAVALDAGGMEVGDLCAYADWDGTLVAIGRRSVFGSEDETSLWWSHDLGDTWYRATDQIGLVYSSGEGTATRLRNLAACAVAGQAVVLHNWDASPGNEDGSIGAMWLGGWHSLGISRVRPAQEYLTWGGEDASARGRVWLPLDLPEDMALWTRAGTAPTLTAGAMNVTTAAATSISTYVPWTTDLLAGNGIIQVQLVSGATTDATTGECAAEFRFANGVNEYTFQIRLGTAKFALYDVSAAASIGTAATVALTTQIVIAWSFNVSTLTASTWYWRLGDTLAVAGPTGVVSSAGAPAATSRIRLGHLSATTAVSNWYLFAWRTNTTLTAGQYWAVGQTAAEGHTMSALGYPVPSVGTATAHAYLAAQAGPGRAGETWDIDPEHDYPIEHALVGLYPGTQTAWRSTSTAEQIIAFTLAAQDTNLGTSQSWGLALLNCNFQTAVLQAYTGAAWATIGTLSLVAHTGTFALDGEVYNTTTGTGTTRHVRHGEAVGGHILTTGGAKARTITAHSGGWLTSNTTAKPAFRFSGYDGTEPAAPTASIVVRSGVLVAHMTLPLDVRRIRIRIPASQVIPDSYYQIGAIVLGSVVALGQQPSNGWSKRIVGNTEESLSRSGVRRVRRLGPAVQEWSWSWVDGLLHSRLSATADYLGSSIGDALVQWQDVSRVLGGMFQHDIQSGAYPVVALEELPDAATASITAPDLFCYGHLTGPIETTQAQGDDSSPELVRVEQITIRGIP